MSIQIAGVKFHQQLRAVSPNLMLDKLIIFTIGMPSWMHQRGMYLFQLQCELLHHASSENALSIVYVIFYTFRDYERQRKQERERYVHICVDHPIVIPTLCYTVLYCVTLCYIPFFQHSVLYHSRVVHMYIGYNSAFRILLTGWEIQCIVTHSLQY